MLVEIPTNSPRFREVICQENQNKDIFNYLIKLERSIDVPDLFLPPDEKKYFDILPGSRSVRFIDERFNDENIREIKGFLSYLGEPHIIIFAGKSIENPFIRINQLEDQSRSIFENFFYDLEIDEEKRRTFLIEIGRLLNMKAIRLPFYKGISIDVVELFNQFSFKIRSYERISNKELVSCGIGSIIACDVAETIGLLKPKKEYHAYSKHCLEKHDDFFVIKRLPDGWSIRGTAEYISNSKGIWRKK